MNKKDTLAGLVLGILLTCIVMVVIFKTPKDTPVAAGNVVEMKLREESTAPVSKSVIVERVETQDGPFMWRMYDRATRVACYATYVPNSSPNVTATQWVCTRATLTGNN